MQILQCRQALLSNYEVYQLLQEQKRNRELKRHHQDDVLVENEGHVMSDTTSLTPLATQPNGVPMMLPVEKDRVSENVLTVEFEVNQVSNLSVLIHAGRHSIIWRVFWVSLLLCLKNWRIIP
jgi:hypothetical protein